MNNETKQTKRIKRYKKVIVDINKNYKYFKDAIEDAGYELVDDGNYYKPIFEKDNKYYMFYSADHFNTMIYSITMVEFAKKELIRDEKLLKKIFEK